MSAEPKRRLGRGLAALIGDDTSEESIINDFNHLRHVPVELLFPSPQNPRKFFREEELLDLANSIKEKGLLQPLVVRPRNDGRSYEIVAGERRWRAAQKAGIHDIPVLIRHLSDGESLEIALIENVQRSDLTPIEEARGYVQLIEEFSYTQQQLADSVGKSRSHIANTMRLLNLPEKVLTYVEDGQLSAGHARTLIGNKAAEELAQKIVKSGMSVRQAEDLNKRAIEKPAKVKKSEGAQPAKTEKSTDILALENELTKALGYRVAIDSKNQETGTISIEFLSLEQLDEICGRLIHH